MAKRQDPFSRVRGLIPPEVTADTGSWRWFKNNVNKIVGSDRMGFDDVVQGSIKDDVTSKMGIISDDQVGKMFMFRYLPKHRNKLRYYDTFPLVLTIGLSKRWITGLNFHYIPPIERQRLFNWLEDFKTDDMESDKPPLGPSPNDFTNTKIRISYDVLNSYERFRYFRPCFKKYLRNRMRSEMLFVPPTEWQLAINLPTENFRKWPKNKVWKESKASVLKRLY